MSFVPCWSSVKVGSLNFIVLFSRNLPFYGTLRPPTSFRRPLQNNNHHLWRHPFNFPYLFFGRRATTTMFKEVEGQSPGISSRVFRRASSVTEDEPNYGPIPAYYINNVLIYYLRGHNKIILLSLSSTTLSGPPSAGMFVLSWVRRGRRRRLDEGWNEMAVVARPFRYHHHHVRSNIMIATMTSDSRASGGRGVKHIIIRRRRPFQGR